MKALITAGGHGTRLRPITHTHNKHLIPIANKPILQYAIDYVKEAGITEIGIIINAASDGIKEWFGDGSNQGLSITYIPQEAPMGLAHCVKIAEPFIGTDKFIFYLGDNMIVGGVKRFIDEFEQSNANCFLTLSNVKDPQRFGVPEIVDGRIIGIEEKPLNPKSNFAVAGIYLYDSSVFEAVNNIKPSPRGELEISDAHQYLLDHNYVVKYTEITGWWKDTGKPADLLAANRLVLDNITEECEGDIDSSSTVVGPNRIGKGSRIINSIVRGPVCIGSNCHIENSFIGPHTSIGNGTQIINSEVEYSILLNRCIIKDLNTRLETSLLGNEVEVVLSEGRPRVNRLMIGDQSRVELI